MDIFNNDGEKLKSICSNNDISYLALFGSYVRGEQTVNSDIDLLVEYSTSKSMFDHVRIQRAFEEATNKKVDLVTKRSLHPYIKDFVCSDIKILYTKDLHPLKTQIEKLAGN
ncbi:MAG: hypothetical protein ACD_22C00190G0005 [uncultured bacterium]|nr:MAG: hypothetical protein ACD_22C00190G0005 [uncultured bacterium]